MTEHSRIVRYYDECESDYRWLWDLEHSMSLHIGYWESRTRTLREALARQISVMADAAGVSSSDRVLDAGCGVGGTAIRLAQWYGAFVHGITVSERQVRVATENATRHGVSHRVRFDMMDFEKTSLPDESFNVVWGCESACYAREKAAFAREAYRILQPGGRLIVADGFRARDAISSSDSKLLTRWLDCWAAESIESVRDFGAILAEAGFGCVKFQDITSHILPSAKRLYWHSLYGLPASRLGQFFGLRDRAQTRNALGARLQFAVCRRGIACYGIFTARKEL